MYPLEVVIVQDLSDSFGDDFQVMKETELPAMYKELTESHPGSAFGAVSFVDKPISPFGWPLDWCWKNEAAIGADLAALQSVYGTYETGGGQDFPENQAGAILSTAQAKKLNWGSVDDSVRLVVLSTDAPAHYDDETDPTVDRKGMLPYNGTFDEDNVDNQCVEVYYPSYQEVIRELTHPADGSIPPYVAFLVYDDGFNNKTLDSYRWLASEIAENDSFVRDRGANSTEFWTSLSAIIGIIDSLECNGTVSSTSTVLPETLVTETHIVTTETTTSTPILTSTGSVTQSETCPGCDCPPRTGTAGCPCCSARLKMEIPCDAKVVHVDIIH